MVTFSSVHRAKGLEADNVFIIKPSSMPSPRAKKQWEQVQEQNIRYVAFTRAKDTLYMVE
jgi:superfamily I DNA/RNA helicase